MNPKNKLKLFLRWSEQYTQTDMVYLVSGASWLILGRVFIVILLFVSSLIFANFCSKENYGTYRFILSILSMVGLSTLSGMPTAMISAISKGHDRTIIKVIPEEIKWGFLGGIATALIGIYYLFQQNTVLGSCLLWISPLVPFMNVFNLYSSIFQGKKLFKSSSIYDILYNFFSITAVLAAVLLTQNVKLIILTYCFASVTTQGLLFLNSLKKINLKTQVDKKSIEFGKNLSLSSIISALATILDQVLLFHYMGASALAIYLMAYGPTEQFRSLIKLFQSLALPKWTNQKKTNLKKTLFKKMFQFLMLLGVLILIFIALTPWLYKIFFPHYLASIIYAQVFAVSIIPTGGMMFLLAAIQSQGSFKYLERFYFWTPWLQIVLLFIFVARFGIAGAIFSRVFVRFVNFFIVLFLAKKF